MISTEYKGYRITYNENADEWSCSDAGYVSNAKLAPVKASIDKMLLAHRKKASFDVIFIGHSDPIEGRAIDAKLHTGRTMGNPGGHRVGVLMKRSGNARAAKSWEPMSSIAKPGPETDAAIAEWQRLSKVAAEAATKAREAKSAIPTITVEDLADLAQAADDRPET